MIFYCIGKKLSHWGIKGLLEIFFIKNLVKKPLTDMKKLETTVLITVVIENFETNNTTKEKNNEEKEKRR